MLALDLADLHLRYTPAEILRLLRVAFVIRDRQWYDDQALFLHATRLYFGVDEGKEEKAEELYDLYRSTGTIPLEIARCLIA
jgi:hypothetical protein